VRLPVQSAQALRAHAGSLLEGRLVRQLHIRITMTPPTGALFTSHPVQDGCVQCTLQGRAVPASDCEHCARGFLVRFDGEARYALCPSDLKTATVGDIMSRRVVATRPTMPIESLILLLVDEAIGAVPVIDDDHRPIGMVSKSDLVFDDYEWAELRDEAFWLRRVAKLPKGLETEGDLYLSELLRSRTVGDIMSGDPLTVTPQTRVVEAARLMAEKHIHGCPVIDASGKLIAVVTSIDVARWVGAQA
jgi:CBS domain-containing protein